MDSGTFSDDHDLTATGESEGSSSTEALAPERRKLGHYLLLDEIGRGGMGVVYAAHDSKLGRKVAIKMLRREGGAKLQRRLIREAQAMAKLAHPNVVAVHEIGEHEGAAFIVMDHVEGQTLRRWLAAMPRSVNEILATFMAAGRGLAAVHEAGLVHRDFKPDNVMIRDSGQVLVTDLGIARDGSSAFLPATATLEGLADTAMEPTRDSTLVGSPAYMAAEQFVGEEVTPKTDQFSFCVALWEALYRERPFPGESMALLIDAVTENRLRASKRSDVPAALRSVLERGLQAEPAARFESMTDLLGALELASGSRRRTRIRIAWVTAAVVALVATFFGVGAALDRTPPEPTQPAEPTPEPVEPIPETAEPPAHRQVTTSGDAARPTLSPDGNHVVFVDDHALVHVDLRSGESKKLAPKINDVLGSSLSNDGSLMFSARLNDEEDGGIYRMSSLDAAPIRVNDAHIFCRFRDRDRLVSFKVTERAVKVSDSKGSVVAEVPVEGSYDWMSQVACDPRNNRIVVLRSLGTTSALALIDLDGKPARVLVEGSFDLASPSFDATGDTLYYLATRDGQTNLEAAAVAAKNDLPVTRVVVADIDAEDFSRADSGRLAYERWQTIHRGIWRLGPAATSLERAERIVETDAEDVVYAMSPDETRLAYVETRRNVGRLMIRSLSDGSQREVTRADQLARIAWSPDGQTIAFIAQYRGQAHVWTVPAAGGMPKVFKGAPASGNGAPIAWAPSASIIYERPENRNFGVLDPNTEADRPLIAGEPNGWPFYPAVSPDGTTVAMLWSRESIGVWAIDIEKGTSRQLIEGEYYPFSWSADGRFVYADVQDESTAKLYRIPAVPTPEKQLEPWRTIDFGPRHRGACLVTSTEMLLCDAVETTSDIWIAGAIE